jgi:hypothetical protein
MTATKRVPDDLKQADRLLYQYGCWAQDRYKKQHCASIEHKYRAPPMWSEDEPMEPFIADFRAMDVQRTLNLVPIQYRRVLHASYIPQRLPPDAIRRSYKLSPRTWAETFLAGVRMFDNNWRCHGPTATMNTSA